MITAEQEEFIRKYVSKEYFNVDQVINYLKLHDIVGGEIFAIAPLPEDKLTHPGRLELLREGFGFNAIDKETFIKRIPFISMLQIARASIVAILNASLVDIINLQSMMIQTMKKYMKSLSGCSTITKSALLT